MSAQYAPNVSDDDLAAHLEAIVVPDDEEEQIDLDDFLQEDEENDELVYLGSTITDLRAMKLPRGALAITSVRPNDGYGGRLRLGDTIEITSDEFFRIESLYKTQDGKFFAQGFQLLRNRAMQNFLPKQTNEVAIFIEVKDERQDRDITYSQTVIELPRNLVVRECVFTNVEFPFESFRHDPRKVGPLRQHIAKEDYHLTCRRVVVQKMLGKRPVEQIWRNIEQHECAALGGVVVDDREIRARHITLERSRVRYRAHQHAIVKGMHSRWDNAMQHDLQDMTISNYEVTYGDICAGGGGTARAAFSAGLTLRFLLDHAQDMVNSLHLNWPTLDVDIRCQSIFEFCRRQQSKAHSMPLDVLHISFPCCAHSYLNRGGKNDEVNIAAGYSLQPLLNITRPLIVTFEQVPAIRTRRKGENYEDLIYQLTSLGYSVRARVEKLNEHGHCARRARLIMFASCPGQSLPTFPETTHGEGKSPFATMKDMLRNLVGVNPPEHMKKFRAVDGVPYSPDQPMKNTITGGGGLSNIHFNGRRTWSLAEFASLQGFPWYHKFFGRKTSILKQIGNAVPPVAMEPFFKQVRRHILRTDREYARQHFSVVIKD